MSAAGPTSSRDVLVTLKFEADTRSAETAAQEWKKAASEAFGEVNTAMAQEVSTAFSELAEGVVKAGRGFGLLAAAQSESIESMVRWVINIEAAVAVVKGLATATSALTKIKYIDIAATIRDTAVRVANAAATWAQVAAQLALQAVTNKFVFTVSTLLLVGGGLLIYWIRQTRLYEQAREALERLTNSEQNLARARETADIEEATRAQYDNVLAIEAEIDANKALADELKEVETLLERQIQRRERLAERIGQLNLAQRIRVDQLLEERRAGTLGTAGRAELGRLLGREFTRGENVAEGQAFINARRGDFADFLQTQDEANRIRGVGLNPDVTPQQNLFQISGLQEQNADQLERLNIASERANEALNELIGRLTDNQEEYRRRLRELELAQ